MNGPPIYIRSRRPPQNLVEQLSSRLVGQSHAIEQIVPYVQMHRAGLAAEGRPVGVFLLLGPTGTGKTRTVEALADALHGSEKQVLRIDCGEFQLDHEVAKLIGAPPGYLGHRETTPMLTQQKLTGVTSENSNLSLVLFDEIEKAAPSMMRILLGVLDKATLRLGDNTSVNFDRSMIFLTSNLGADEMKRETGPGFGFEPATTRAQPTTSKLNRIGLGAVKRRFAPEFVNRIDAIVTYNPLDRKAIQAIFDHQLAALESHIESRLESRAFDIRMEDSAREFLLELGTSPEYGARELKRVILRHVTQPIAALVETGSVPPGSEVVVWALKGSPKLAFDVLS